MDSSNENTTPLVRIFTEYFEKQKTISCVLFLKDNGITPEMSEEAKLKAKYGGALPRQQKLLTRKLITKVKTCFFNLYFKEYLRLIC
jgi:hypothetical protein